MVNRVVVVGGGAAGFFAAITCAELAPNAEVILLEKTTKLLSKVLVSGGGRCNVTNAVSQPAQLAKNYPRGQKPLKRAFELFGQPNTLAWFEKRGVRLKTEWDGRIFPVTDSSETIINCLVQAAQKAGVSIRTGKGVTKIKLTDSGAPYPFSLELTDGSELGSHFLTVATGGRNKPEDYQWLQESGHRIVPPVPSLFTFNAPKNPFPELMGVSVPNALVKVVGQKLEEEGPLLITHWGLSGPAVLRSSAWGARLLQEKQYRFDVLVSWIGRKNEEETRTELVSYGSQFPKRKVESHPLFQLPSRLWAALLEQAEVPEGIIWAEVPKKNLNKLVEGLLRTPFQVHGKTTFKEEFVTAGGVSWEDVDPLTLESRKVPHLHFAGEVLDADGITGGFNFQAAWTTGYLAGKHIADQIRKQIEEPESR